MKFVEPNGFTDPDAAARKLVEIANAVEAVQDGGFTSSLSMPHSSRPVARRTSSAPASNAPLHRAGSGCMNQEPVRKGQLTFSMKIRSSCVGVMQNPSALRANSDSRAADFFV
jgi:hypothetical protein